MRLNSIIWRRLRRLSLLGGLLAVFCLAYASNHFLYLSHQSFPVLSRLQWNHPSSSVHRGTKPIIIGHRGSGLRSTDPDAAEENRLIGNTRRSIQAAIDAKVDWIEIDIRASKDGALLVFHDAEIDEKTTHSGRVSNMTLDALKAADLLVDPTEKILTLKEVFDEFHSDERYWVLDVKVEEIHDKVLALIESSKIPKNQIIIFGNHDVLENFKGKGYRLGYTALFTKHRSMILSSTDVIKRCKDNSYDLLVVPLLLVTQKLVASAQENGIEVWSYGSDDSLDLKYCTECGVTGLIVDQPNAAMLNFGE